MDSNSLKVAEDRLSILDNCVAGAEFDNSNVLAELYALAARNEGREKNNNHANELYSRAYELSATWGSPSVRIEFLEEWSGFNAVIGNRVEALSLTTRASDIARRNYALHPNKEVAALILSDTLQHEAEILEKFHLDRKAAERRAEVRELRKHVKGCNGVCFRVE
jgi:hypothetical protein